MPLTLIYTEHAVFTFIFTEPTVFTIIYSELVTFTLICIQPVASNHIHASYVTTCLLIWGRDWLRIGLWSSFPDCVHVLLTPHGASVELPCSRVPDVPWFFRVTPSHDSLFAICQQSFARSLARPHQKLPTRLTEGSISQIHIYCPRGLTNCKLYTWRWSLLLWLFSNGG